MAKKTASKKPEKSQSETTSVWSVFGYSAFAVMWTATVVSLIGTWIHDLAAGWLMTTLSPSPLMVALVQAATTLPVFLLALPAGALADMWRVPVPHSSCRSGMPSCRSLCRAMSSPRPSRSIRWA
jgi:MFS family permease